MGLYQNPTALNLSPKIKEEIGELAESLNVSDHRLAVEAVRIGLDRIKQLQAEGNPPEFPPIKGGNLGKRRPIQTAA